MRFLRSKAPCSLRHISISGRGSGHKLPSLSLAALLLIPEALTAADLNPLAASTREAGRSARIVGRAAVLDGRTLWLPDAQILVRLAGIDSCDLPQWAFDPHASRAGPLPAPVACGALAMGWLKRLVGDKRVNCTLELTAGGQAALGLCRVGTVDLGHEMLRVGWARLTTGGLRRPDYRAAQTQAVNGQYGMWGTYVLDTDEWRAKAVDRTLGRQPFADWNLLATRERDGSPALRDARKQPLRRDR